MISYNNPKDTERRSNVVPLSLEEMETLIKHLNSILPQYGAIISDNLQRLLDRHANLQHFYDNAVGWEGLAKLQETADSVAINNEFPSNEKFWVQVKWLIENKLSGQTISKANIKKEYFNVTGKNMHGTSILWATKKLQEMNFITINRDKRHEIYYTRTQG